MAFDPPRPWPGPPTIGIDGEVKILRDLLDIERERLIVARQIEKDRSIVFPETTVIVRDIERLLGKVRAKEEAQQPESSRGALAESEALDDIAQLLRDAGA